ncbi:MAG: translation elongation factor Ts [Chloroflexi bacterium]|nr:translation elongation factor Ts [Chloroflexota bacterium]
MVKALRERTGVGPLDCKKALEAHDGDMDAAAKFLREKGLAKADKKASRAANEGLVQTYQHFNGRIGVLAEVNCETDFVANTDQFREFARDLVLHIANMAPQFVQREDVPEAMVEAERQLQRERALQEGKPEHIVDKVVEGRMDKFFEEIVLLEQSFIKDDSKKIEDLRKEVVASVGENVVISRFARFEIGESDDQDEDED